MHPGALKVFDVSLPKYPCHLLSYDRDQLQFFLQISVFVVQAGSKDVGVTSKQCWIVFDQDTLHAVRVNRFEVGQMTHDLLYRPRAGDRMERELIFASSAYGGSEQFGSLFILLKQPVKCHVRSFRWTRGQFLKGSAQVNHLLRPPAFASGLDKPRHPGAGNTRDDDRHPCGQIGRNQPAASEYQTALGECKEHSKDTGADREVRDEAVGFLTEYEW